jgi:phage baseplate assembly protein gpV
MVDDGSRYAGVQVLAPTAGSNAGVFDMPEPSETADKWSLSQQRDNEMLAVASMLAGSPVPVVLGFLYPQVNGMLFADRERRVVRHASDVYTTIDRDGNMEVAHPNGTYLRIGTDPEHEDLTGRDFDGNWKITKNTGKQTHVKLVVKAGGAEKASVHIDPSGNVTVEHAGNLVVNTAGSATVDVAGAVNVTAGGAATVEAPSVTIDSPATTCTGALTVQGLLTYQAGLAGSGGSGASMTGNLNVTGNITSTGNVTNNGKAIGSTHVHGGVQAGGSTSGAPA